MLKEKSVREEEADAVAAVLEAFAEAINGAGTGEIASLWDPEAAVMRPGAPVLLGRENIVLWFECWIRDYRHELEYETGEPIVFGEWAWVDGTFTIRSVPCCGGETSFLDGKFLFVLRRSPAGGWSIFRQCGNGSVPPPASRYGE
jgi:ketosteroid isomerase-like protein